MSPCPRKTSTAPALLPAALGPRDHGLLFLIAADAAAVAAVVVAAEVAVAAVAADAARAAVIAAAAIAVVAAASTRRFVSREAVTSRHGFLPLGAALCTVNLRFACAGSSPCLFLSFVPNHP